MTLSYYRIEAKSLFVLVRDFGKFQPPAFEHNLFLFFLNQTILSCDQVQLNIVNYSKCWQSVVNSPKLNQLRMQSNSAKPAVGKSQAKVKKLFVKIQSTTGQLE